MGPEPAGPWIMAQIWTDLLFAHWPIGPAALREIVPRPLEIEPYDGQAWLGVIPFGMQGVRPRGIPPLPWLSRFLELNVRTYVTLGGVSGVYFFSLDAGNPLAVAAARRWFHLPYYRARMQWRTHQGVVEYRSRRTHRAAPSAELAVDYRPRGAPFTASHGSFAEWATERYRLYTTDAQGAMWTAEIRHPRWSLQEADATFRINTMTQALGLGLPASEPILHFARRQGVHVWPLRPAPDVQPPTY
jgi:uncharacterized protein YqjF (DUF2071 family)